MKVSMEKENFHYKGNSTITFIFHISTYSKTNLNYIKPILGKTLIAGSVLKKYMKEDLLFNGYR